MQYLRYKMHIEAKSQVRYVVIIRETLAEKIVKILQKIKSPN